MKQGVLGASLHMHAHASMQAYARTYTLSLTHHTHTCMHGTDERTEARARTPPPSVSTDTHAPPHPPHTVRLGLILCCGHMPPLPFSLTHRAPRADPLWPQWPGPGKVRHGFRARFASPGAELPLVQLLVLRPGLLGGQGQGQECSQTRIAGGGEGQGKGRGRAEVWGFGCKADRGFIHAFHASRHTQAHTHACHTHTLAHTHAHTRARTHAHTNTHIRAHTHTLTHTHTRTHTHTHTNISAHTHTGTPSTPPDTHARMHATRAHTHTLKQSCEQNTPVLRGSFCSMHLGQSSLAGAWHLGGGGGSLAWRGPGTWGGGAV